MPTNNLPRISAVFCILALVALTPEAQGSNQSPVGSTFRDCPDCPEMIVLPAGKFLMGVAPGEMDHDIEQLGFVGRWLARDFKAAALPQHSVNIRQAFALGKYDVTRGEFARFVRETGYADPDNCTIARGTRYLHPAGASWENPGFPQTQKDPAVCVNWQDAQAYVTWLNSKVRENRPSDPDGVYRLPSESEWEYAARGGREAARWWGESIGSNYTNCDGCGSQWDGKSTAPVDSFHANPFGLYGVLGNVWQLVQDCWHSNYDGAPSNETVWMGGTCTAHVMRGGEWSSDPWIIRSAMRTKPGPSTRTNYIGFRVAKALR